MNSNVLGDLVQYRVQINSYGTQDSAKQMIIMW